MIRESPQRLNRTLLQEIFQEAVDLWTTMLMACNVVAHFERYAILFKGHCIL